MTIEDNTTDEIDDAALELALTQAMARDLDTCTLIEWKLDHGEERFKVARFAAYSMQNMNLRLDATQDPPIWIDDIEETLMQRDWRGSHDAAKLLRTMLALGISRYHPDPIKAIEAAQAGR